MTFSGRFTTRPRPAGTPQGPGRVWSPEAPSHIIQTDQGESQPPSSNATVPQRVARSQSPNGDFGFWKEDPDVVLLIRPSPAFPEGTPSPLEEALTGPATTQNPGTSARPHGLGRRPRRGMFFLA